MSASYLFVGGPHAGRTFMISYGTKQVLFPDPTGTRPFRYVRQEDQTFTFDGLQDDVTLASSDLKAADIIEIHYSLAQPPLIPTSSGGEPVDFSAADLDLSNISRRTVAERDYWIDQLVNEVRRLRRELGRD
jgi:hypothetical protein